MTEQAQPKPRVPMYPRDEPGNFTLPVGSNGTIQRMVALGNYMEIYTEFETFRFQTPESIDPGRTNPNAMFVNAKAADVGSSEGFVARTLLMAHDLLNTGIVVNGEQREALLFQMHKIKETLAQCVKAANALRLAENDEVKKFEASGGQTTARGRMLAYFPVVPELEAKVTAILIPARRAITEICQIPLHFWNLKRPHSDPTNLLEKELGPSLGEGHQLVGWLHTMLQGAKWIVDMRNAQEHAGTTKSAPFIVRNFELLPTNQVTAPRWGLGDDNLTYMADDLDKLKEFLIAFAEEMLVLCVNSNLPTFPPMNMFQVDKPDEKCPSRYVLKIDDEKFLEAFQRQQCKPQG